MEKRSVWATVAMWLAIIGALNWGLIGFFNFNLVDAIFGGGARETTSGFSRFIYALVGLAGIASIFGLASRREAGGRIPTRVQPHTP